MIGAWLSPPITILGTLWLARRSERLRLRIRVRLYRDHYALAVGSNASFTGGDVIVFSVTNTSRRPVTLESVGWAYREKWRKWRWHLQTEEMGVTLPLKLERGEHKEMRFYVGDGCGTVGAPVSWLGKSFCADCHGPKDRAD